MLDTCPLPLENSEVAGLVAVGFGGVAPAGFRLAESCAGCAE
jgi:hypothetical protein